MAIDKNSNKLDARIAAALAKYQPLHIELEHRARLLAQRVVILVEKCGGRSAAAQMLNVGPTTIDNYRSGHTQPRFLEYLSLCEAAGEAIESTLYESIGIKASEISDKTANPSISPEIALQIVEWIKLLGTSDESVAMVTQRAVDAYNRLIERADDPTDVEELKALLPWLKRQLEKSLDPK